jgi:BirA family biotin operon repressor/biotin-[acetyl-CoA-carboxylase] ligase
MIDVEILDSAASTMDAARDRFLAGTYPFRNGVAALYCVAAREQTGGRGQRGRTWFARAGESLAATYTIHCPPVTEPVHSRRIGIIAGVALAEVICRYCSGIEVGLKWPNDLMLNGRKAGGILVEMMKSPASVSVALIGVGVNVAVRDFPKDLAENATSMAREGIQSVDLPDVRSLAAEIGDALVSQIQESCADPAACVSKWRRFDASTGRRYEYELTGTVEQGGAVGIADDGALILQLDSGAQAVVTSATSLREVT